LFGKIRPPIAKNIKKNCIIVCGKKPKKLQILKLQYLDFPDSFLDDFFFQLGCFSERKSDIKNISLNVSHKYQKFMEFRDPLFSSPKKKIYKNKKYLLTMSAKESVMIPLAKNMN
jgi:hypothetical protein